MDLPINKIICGDCIDVLKTFPENSIDSIITDPPAGIAFMNKKWDDKGGLNNFQDFIFDVFSEVKRVLKPGGHMFVWALPKTSHHTAMGIERAGFEIRDCVYHVFAQGFPKSLNIGKKVDKLQGNKRKYLGIVKGASAGMSDNLVAINKGLRPEYEATKGNSEWEGWGTCLKPSVECWWLCRKPISEKTIAENCLKWGVGGINIDDCRIPYTQENQPIPQLAQDKTEIKTENKMYGRNSFNKSKTKSVIGGNLKGRFPSNLILDGSEEVNSLFPNTKSGARSSKHKIGNEQGEMFNHGIYGKYKSKKYDDVPASEGSASRFFYKAELDNDCSFRFLYQAKPSKKERGKYNTHPTIKSLNLMKYLIKMITPKNGIVLDPFLGSGSTAIAAKAEGFDWIGIEKEEEYCKIAEQRIKNS